MTAATSSDYAQAVRMALEKIGREGHIGRVHPTGAPFTYRPSECPGCAESLLEDLATLVERGLTDEGAP